MQNSHLHKKSDYLWTFCAKPGQGIVYSSKVGKSDYLPAHKVRLVDTHGAGDSFIGAFCARLSSGDSFVRAVAYANATAALMVSTEGSDFVSPEVVKRFLRPQRDAELGT